MVSKCANPQCGAAFLYLHQGKLFRIETDAGWPQDPPDPSARKPIRRLEYFWLCDDCGADDAGPQRWRSRDCPQCGDAICGYSLVGSFA